MSVLPGSKIGRYYKQRNRTLSSRKKRAETQACASILHVPRARLPLVLENISRALKKGGHLYASFKYGTFEGDRNGRHFTDMTEDTFEKLVAPFNELTIIETMITGDVRKGREGEKWLNVKCDWKTRLFLPTMSHDSKQCAMMKRDTHHYFEYCRKIGNKANIIIMYYAI